MASIGTLRRNPNGAFKGELRFATFQRPIPVQLFRVRKSKDTAPDFRMIAGNGTEVGAAWIKQNKRTGEDYISVSIALPELGTAIYGTLGKMPNQPDENLFSIIWNMPNSAIPQSNFDEDSYGDGTASYAGNSYDSEPAQEFV